MPYVALVGRALLGVVFLVAVLTKATSSARFAGFTSSLRRLQVLPGRWARPVAVTVVATEAVTTLLLATPVSGAAVAGCALAAVVLIGFGAVTAVVVSRGVDASCACFGRSTTRLSWLHVGRNAALAIVAVVAAVASGRGGPANVAGLVLAGVGGGVLGGLVTVLDDFVALFWPQLVKSAAPARRRA